jgi:Ankyrin repeats (3 copies)
MESIVLVGAIKKGNEYLVRKMLNARTEIEPHCDYSDIFFMLVATRGHTHIIQRLLGYSFDRSGDYLGTILAMTVLHRQHDTTRFLLEKGASINAPCPYSYMNTNGHKGFSGTALDAAARIKC